jgi:hypothetical protein
VIGDRELPCGDEDSTHAAQIVGQVPELDIVHRQDGIEGTVGPGELCGDPERQVGGFAGSLALRRACASITGDGSTPASITSGTRVGAYVTPTPAPNPTARN